MPALPPPALPFLKASRGITRTKAGNFASLNVWMTR